MSKPALSKRICCGCLLVFTIVAAADAEVGDPTIQTDHPQYAGEGAFQEVEDCVRFATDGKQSAQDRAIAMYLWMLGHQWHLMSPQEWCIPGRVPDSAVARDYESVVYDANRARFSYGYGLCGTVHAWNEPYWKSLGMNARRRSFPGHANSEIYYDNAWHAFDTDMAGLLFRRDGVVAGYDDIIRDPSLVDSVKKPLPHYPFAWPSDFNVMKRAGRLWQPAATGTRFTTVATRLIRGLFTFDPAKHLLAGMTETILAARQNAVSGTIRMVARDVIGHSSITANRLTMAASQTHVVMPPTAMASSFTRRTLPAADFAKG
ncbi:MAG: hypothetical protein ACKVHE_33105 [Planctomycetales bacterium]